MPVKKSKSGEGLEIEEIGYSFSENLAEKLESFQKSFTLLVIVGEENYEAAVSGIVENLAVRKKLKGVYITANRQSAQMLGLFSKSIEGFDESSLYFLDCASKNGKESVKNISYCNPQNIIDVNNQSMQALDALPSGSFIVLDSISTLATCNDGKVLKKFVKSMVEKCSLRKISGIFIYSLTKENKAFKEEIAPFFDETMDAGKI